MVDSLNFSATAVSFIDRRASDSESKLAPPLLSTLSALPNHWERHSVIQRYTSPRCFISMASSVFFFSPSLSPNLCHFVSGKQHFSNKPRTSSKSPISIGQNKNDGFNISKLYLNKID